MSAKHAHASKGKLHGFYQELEQLLKKQLDAQPELDDVRSRLLELYFEQRRPTDFMQAAKAYQHRLKHNKTSRDWQKVASMGRILVPGEPLFSGAGNERIEFVDAVTVVAQKEAPKIRRFGDEDRHRPLFESLAAAYEPIRSDGKFFTEHELALVSLGNRRPTPLIHAKRLSEHVGGAQIYIKREDLAGDSPHLTVALTGQALLARRLGKKTLVVGTTDGRRGVIGAAIAARLGLKMVIFMDADQAQRRNANVLFSKLMGADLNLVKASDYRNRDVREAALDFWFQNPEDTFLLTGLDASPAPYPVMTQEFTAAIGRETRRQFSSQVKRVPDLVCTRGSQSADALALFPAFLSETKARLVCVETEAPAAPATVEDPFNVYALPLTSGERHIAKNILDGLEYPSVAREHALFRASGRVEYVHASRNHARDALLDVARFEGIVPSLETAHVLSWAMGAALELDPGQAVLVMMADSPDNDVWEISQLVGAGTRRRAT